MAYRGIVHEGKKRGRELGYPTANITLEDEAIDGIYAARVSFDGATYAAAAFADPARNLLELHLLDFTGADFYGKTVEAVLVGRVRDSRRFDSDEALQKAIADDILKIRSILSA